MLSIPVRQGYHTCQAPEVAPRTTLRLPAAKTVPCNLDKQLVCCETGIGASRSRCLAVERGFLMQFFLLCCSGRSRGERVPFLRLLHACCSCCSLLDWKNNAECFLSSFIFSRREIRFKMFSNWN